MTSDNERLVMSNLGHQHIVRLEQVIMDGGEMHLLLSLCSGGDLQNWNLCCTTGVLRGRFLLLAST